MLNLILSKVQHFLKHEKTFDSYHRLPQYNDEPKLSQYFLRIKDNDSEEFGSGTSLDEDRAKTKAIAEAIERFSLDSKNYHYKLLHCTANCPIV